MHHFSLNRLIFFSLYAIITISIVFVGIFYLRLYFSFLPDDADFESQIEAFGTSLDLLIYWAYALLIAAILFSLAFPVIRLIKNPQSGIKSLVMIGIFALIFFISYALSDNTLLDLKGYTGEENVPAVLAYADTLIFSTYIMLILAFLSIVFSELIKVFR